MIRRLHALYSRTERVKDWFSSRFTTLGKMMVLLAAASFFFGLNTQRSMIYQIFTLSFSGLLFSFVLTLRGLPLLSVRRYLPQNCMVDEPVRYRVVVENQGNKKYGGLLYQEDISKYIPDLLEFSTSREEGEEKRNFFDRKMLYYRWLWLLRIGRKLQSIGVVIPDVQPGQRVEFEAELLPLSRGHAHVEGYRIIRVDPLGLCKREVCTGEMANVLVLPRLYQIREMYFRGARKYHQGGITLAREKGDSNEFLSLREYMHGDPVKHIDWKSTARSGRTTVKQYRDEYFSRYGLVLDSFTSHNHSEIFEVAVSIAASVMMKQDNVNAVLDLLFVGQECVTCTVGKGIADKQRMMEMLASVTTCRDKPFSEMTALVQSHSHLLSGIVVVVIDWDEDRQKLVDHLIANRIPTQLIRVVENKKTVSDSWQQSTGVTAHLIEHKQAEEQLRRI